MDGTGLDGNGVDGTGKEFVERQVKVWNGVHVKEMTGKARKAEEGD